ncbi:g7559 [Coccomyxa elongata]
MSNSDSDDEPLFKRATKARRQDDADRRSNSGSPLPEWLSQNTSPVKTLELLSDSDEVVEVASGDDDAEEKHEVGPRSAASGEQAAKKRRAAPRGRGGRRVNRVLLSSENDDSGDEGSAGEEQPSARKRQKTVPATQLSQKSPSQNATRLLKKHKAEDSAVGNGSASQQTLQKIAEEAEQPDGEIGGEGTQADATKGSQAVKAAKTPLGKAAALAPVAGEIPIMMPEKLSLTKFIVELEGGNDSSVDLAGDAGVVGRWLVEGDDKTPELKMDLKGVVYAATTVPCATTLCVVNLSATEARVEAMSQQYIQLRPLGAQGPAGDDDADNNYFMYDDDDNYQYEGNAQHQGAGDHAEPGAKAAKRKSKAAAGKAKKAPVAKRSGAGGKPAKKKPVKAAGKLKR